MKNMNKNDGFALVPAVLGVIVLAVIAITFILVTNNSTDSNNSDSSSVAAGDSDQAS
jgi:competence protein ComGC